MSDKYMIIMRGLPGSGKSTIAKNIYDYQDQFPTHQLPLLKPGTLLNPGNGYGFTRGPEIVSADDYMINTQGEYVFDSTKLGLNHTLCFARALYLAHEEHHPLIIIDNTNMSRHEISPYLMLGQLSGYRILILHVEPPRLFGGVDTKFLAEKNVHGVPHTVISDMSERMERLPTYWPEEKQIFPQDWKTSANLIPKSSK